MSFTVYKECFDNGPLDKAFAGIKAELEGAVQAVYAQKAVFDEALATETEVNGEMHTPSSLLTKMQGRIDDMIQRGKDRGVPLASTFYETIQAVSPESPADREERLSAHGIHVVDGLGLIEAGTNLVGTRDLYRTLDRDVATWNSFLSGPEGSVIATVWATVPVTTKVITGCGELSTETNTKPVFAGFNRNVKAVASEYGVSVDKVIVSVYWLESVSSSPSAVLLLHRLGLSLAQVSAIMSEADFCLPDGSLPPVTNFGGPVIRTSLLVEANVPEFLSRYMSAESAIKLMNRALPLGLRGLFSNDDSATTPIGIDFFTAVDAKLSQTTGTSTIGGGIRLVPNDIAAIKSSTDPLFGIQSTPMPLMNPSTAVLALVDVASTVALVGGDGQLSPCQELLQMLARESVIVPILTQTVDMVVNTLRMVVTTVARAVQAIISGVTAILDQLNRWIQSILEMLGLTGVLASLLLCLLGPVGIPGLGVDFVNSTADEVLALIDMIAAPINALLSMLGLLSVPVCIALSALEAILPEALLRCLPTSVRLPPELFDCLNEQLRKVRQPFETISQLLGNLKDEIQRIVSFLRGPLIDGLSLGAASLGACFPTSVAAVAASVSVGFR